RKVTETEALSRNVAGATGGGPERVETFAGRGPSPSRPCRGMIRGSRRLSGTAQTKNPQVFKSPPRRKRHDPVRSCLDPPRVKESLSMSVEKSAAPNVGAL